MALRIPQPLKREHQELHGELVKALSAGGQTGRMAKAVAKLLHPHFVKEEEFALPPLGLLPIVTKGRITPNMKQAVSMIETLKSELPRMLREHKGRGRGAQKTLGRGAAGAKNRIRPFC